MKLCVFGATGPVGRAVVRQALDRGHEVVALSRRPGELAMSGPGLLVVGGDVSDPDQVEAAVRGVDAVISVVGVNPSRRAITTYSVGTRNMLAAMHELGVRRIVSVSSKNLAEQGTTGDPALFRLVLGPLLHAVNRTLYADMRRMELLLRESDRDWTVVRPAGLFAADRVSDYRVTTGHEAGVFTSTVDLADALVAEALRRRSARRSGPRGADQHRYALAARSDRRAGVSAPAPAPWNVSPAASTPRSRNRLVGVAMDVDPDVGTRTRWSSITGPS